MFNTTNYENNANLNHNDTSGRTNQNTCSFSPLYNPNCGEQQMSGREEGFIRAHTWGCIQSNIRERRGKSSGSRLWDRLLAHISMDQEAEIKTGSRAKLESSTPPRVPPLGITAQRSFTTAFPSAGNQESAHHMTLHEYILYLYCVFLLLAPMGSGTGHNAKVI